MSSHKIELNVGNNKFYTLEDILPDDKMKLKALFVAKVPTLKSIEKGHYFQGRQGRMFWNKLINYGLLKASCYGKEDDALLANSYGIVDMAKEPKSYGVEPSRFEYISGMQRLLNVIEVHNPSVIIFVYKGVIDKLLEYGLGIYKKSIYGFNDDLGGYFNNCRIFAFPMPGTPCDKKTAEYSMGELVKYLDSINYSTFPPGN